MKQQAGNHSCVISRTVVIIKFCE